MKRQRIAVATATLVALTGCGSIHGAPAAAATQSSVQASPATVSAAHASFVPKLRFDFTRPIRQGTIECDRAGWAGPPNLAKALSYARGIAVIRLDKRSSARWNTSDGTRPTEDQAQAIVAGSAGKVEPFLYTGWTLHIVGPVLRGSLPSSLTGYFYGGVHAQDSMPAASCTMAAPVEGGTYLAAFGPEIGEQASSTLHEPIVDDLFAYDPATGSVTAPGGVVQLPANLPALGPVVSQGM
jgi:hypothetical protein